MGELTDKGKHTVKVGNHPHTNMLSKPAIVRRGYKCRMLETHLKLRDQQLKTILYIYRQLYQNLMVTTNQNSTIEIPTKKNPNTTLVIKSKEKKGEGKKRELQNNPKTMPKMAI